MKHLAALLLAASAAHSASLAARIDQILAAPAARGAFWGIRIADAASGRVFYQLNAGRLFVPASNTKLFTTSLALTRLGPDFTFRTRVVATAAPDPAGRIPGDLILIGGGDPNLSARVIPYHPGPSTGDPLSAIRDFASQIAARGVTRIDGDIVGDDTWYVWEPYGPGWSLDDPQYDYGAPVSALAIHDNAFTLSVHPGEREGDPAAISLNPPFEYYVVDNLVRTGPANGERRIRAHRDPGSREIRLRGAIPLGDKGEDLQLAIEDPAEYAALALRGALEERGIVVAGAGVARHLLPGQPAPPDPDGIELAARVSVPFLEDLRVTDKVSQNLHAEMALRAVGRARGAAGTREAGLEEMKAFLAEAGLEQDSYNLNDGSGLARLNLVSPNAVVGLLRYMYKSPAREAWLSLLPVGGQDGTLGSRFAGAAEASRIQAKTGSLSHVSALSGYVRRRDGSRWAFSILVNNYNARAADIHGIMDRICILMLE